MKIRIKFEKKGPLKFIGHLDTMRYFQRAIRRAGLDIVYTKGFSPHPVMSFALPLGVGIESEGEYFDIQVHSTLSSKQAIAALNEQMSEGILITGYFALPDNSKKAMSLVEAADYRVRLQGNCAPPDWPQKLMAFCNQPEIRMIKQTKKSERELDIRPLIFHIQVCEQDETQQGPVITMRLKAGSVDNIKPQLVMEAFFQSMGLELPDYALQIMRLDLFALSDAESLDENSLSEQTAREFESVNQRQFISLGLLGETI